MGTFVSFSLPPLLLEDLVLYCRGEFHRIPDMLAIRFSHLGKIWPFNQHILLPALFLLECEREHAKKQ
jgi:hypothetical protein